MEENEIQPFRFEIIVDNEKEFVIEVSKEDYERDLACGMIEEELLKPGKHKFRRVPPERRATKEDLHPSNTKVEFQMKLDLDVLEHFQIQTENEEIESLQLLLNKKLRAVMESELKLKEVENRLLNDKDFIAAIAEEIKKAA
ncbi:MAG: hypothetical protein ACR2F2_07620 [Pyrinomonadaceae bacterium]